MILIGQYDSPFVRPGLNRQLRPNLASRAPRNRAKSSPA